MILRKNLPLFSTFASFAHVKSKIKTAWAIQMSQLYFIYMYLLQITMLTVLR